MEDFRVFDNDHNGFITVDNLRHVISNIGESKIVEQDIEDLLQESDINND